MKQYREETADAAIKNSINEVGNNPYDDDIATQAEQDIMQALELKLRYSSPEARKQAIIATKNDIASARLVPMIQNNPNEAEEWFNNHLDDFTPEARQKFRETIKNRTQIYKVQAAVDWLIEKYPQGHEQEALNYIRENFTGEIEERIASAYKNRANERAIDLDKNERLLKLNQDKREEEIARNFYVNGVLPTDEQFIYMVQNKQLRPEQAERLQAKADASVMRARIEKHIKANNPNLSPMELDAAVMAQMGTTQEQYIKTFNAAVQAALQGELTDNQLEELYQRGRLTRLDVNKIKKHIKGLEDVQKNFLNAELRDLRNYKGTTINALIEAGLPQEWAEGVENQFIAAVNALDPKSKNYRDEVLKAKKKALIDAMDAVGQRTEGYLWGLTAWGELRETIQDDTLQGRQIEPFPKLPEISPSPINLANVPTSPRMRSINVGQDSYSEFPALGFVEGAVIPNGGRFSSPRNYRKGTHHGIDLSANAGSDIVLQDFNTPLTVKRVGTKNPTSGLGNYVILQGKYDNGDNIEISLGHMQNGSINVTEGQAVNTGDILGKVGNTGMTSDREKGGVTAWYEGKKSGYHLDVKIKINGKFVDPETFRPPVSVPKVTTTKSPMQDFFAIPDNIPDYARL